MTYGGHFDPDTKKSRIKDLEVYVNRPDFWDDREKAESAIQELEKSGVEKEKIFWIDYFSKGN